jgi:hypothetical protein
MGRQALRKLSLTLCTFEAVCGLDQINVIIDESGMKEISRMTIGPEDLTKSFD